MLKFIKKEIRSPRLYAASAWAGLLAVGLTGDLMHLAALVLGSAASELLPDA